MTLKLRTHVKTTGTDGVQHDRSAVLDYHQNNVISNEKILQHFTSVFTRKEKSDMQFK